MGRGVDGRAASLKGFLRHPASVNIAIHDDRDGPVTEYWEKPDTVDRGGIATGGGADGEGGASPLPCLQLALTVFELLSLGS